MTATARRRVTANNVCFYYPFKIETIIDTGLHLKTEKSGSVPCKYFGWLEVIFVLEYKHFLDTETEGKSDGCM